MPVQLTNRSEVEARLGRALTPDEDAVFDAMVRDVSALMYATAPRIPTTLPIPDAVIGVASRLTIKGLEQSTVASTTGIQSESLGGYSISYATGAGAAASSGLALSDSMLDSLAPWMRPRIGSVQIDPTNAVAY